MDSRENLHLARLARQLGLIVGDQFDEACRLCQAQPEAAVVDLFIERGWLRAEDIPHLDYFRGRNRPTDTSRATDPIAVGNTARSLVHRPTVVAERAHSATIIADGTRNDAPASEAKVNGHTPASSARYTIHDLHAVGGMGRVWRAWDHQLHREVAIKELRPEVTKNPSIVNRFLREARLTGQLEHPGIIPVHELDPGFTERGPFYAMRFVQGRTLHRAIAEYHAQKSGRSADGMAFVNLLAAFVGACNTVAYAHSHGVIHRDLKGENVILGDFGEVVVLDWGLAKQVGTAEESFAGDSEASFESVDSRLTMQGQVVGTPAYMSPEQAAGRLDLVDQRTDIYGLGAILYEILTGQPPFVGTTTVEILLAAQRGEPLRPSEVVPGLPAVLEAICIRALAKDPTERFSSAGDLALAVQRWQESERQAAEAELRASRERFELAVEGSQDGLWDWDLTTDKVWFSPRWKELIGYADHELANDVQEWIARLHPEEKTRVLEANFAHIHGTTQHYEYEYRLQHKNGTYRWILARGAALRDTAGKAYRMAGSHVDVTDRRETEQRLREVEQFHEAVMETLPVGVAVLTRDGALHHANCAFAEFVTLPKDAFPVAIGETMLQEARATSGEFVTWDGLLKPGLEPRERRMIVNLPDSSTGITRFQMSFAPIGNRNEDGSFDAAILCLEALRADGL